MAASWHGLLANLGVITLFVILWTYLQEFIAKLKGPARPLTFGILMGLGAVGAMLLPFNVGQGLQFDLRASLIAIGGLFGGPLAGLVGAAIAALYRVSLGGVGALAGCFAISIAFAIGAVGHVLARNNRLNSTATLAFSACVALGTVFSFVAFPSDIRAMAVATVATPLAALTFLSTAIAGLIMLLETRRREVADANRLLRSVFNALPDCLNVKDLQGRFLAANPATARLMRVGSAEELVGKTDFDFYSLENATRFKADEQKVMAEGSPATIEQAVIQADGSTLWLWTLKAPFRDASGALIGLISHNRDITDRKLLGQELDLTRQRLADALEHMADALVMFDRDQRFVFCNAQYREMFAKIADLCVPGMPFRDLLTASVLRGQQVLSGFDLDGWLDERCAAFNVSDDRSIELVDGRWLDARTRPTKDGGALIVFSDVTDRKRAEAAFAEFNRNLAALASTDGLTGLVNRRMFDLGLDREFARARRDNAPLSLLLIDVDRFKAYNDRYGHPAGDECLRRISSCLAAGLQRPGDLVARYGGEEIAAILPDTAADGAHQLAERLRRSVRDLNIPHEASEKGVVTISIGLATTSAAKPAERGAELLRAADQALYAAKTSGRDRVREATRFSSAQHEPLTQLARLS